LTENPAARVVTTSVSSGIQSIPASSTPGSTPKAQASLISVSILGTRAPRSSNPTSVR